MIRAAGVALAACVLLAAGCAAQADPADEGRAERVASQGDSMQPSGDADAVVAAWAIDDAEAGKVYRYEDPAAARDAFERADDRSDPIYLAGSFVYWVKSYANPRTVTCLGPIDEQR